MAEHDELIARVGDPYVCTDALHHQITDAMVERMARAFFIRSKEGRDGFTWPINGERGRQRDMEDARRALVRILKHDDPAILNGEEPNNE